jgi:hypothetical protein
LRILIQVSKWAIWARRLGSLALPMLAIALALHHLRLIPSDVFTAVALAGGAVAALAVLVALVALVRLWFTGDQGWSRALSGLFLGAVCLLPFGYYGSLALEYSPVTDIATVNRSELPLVFEPGTASMPPPKLLGAAEQDALFPNAKTRSYPLGLPQTFQVVRQLVEDNGWTIRFEREPGSGFEPGQINAQIVTLPGWREEAVIRVGGGLTSSVVDMRSASLNAQHDFGSNGKRVEAFLVALDDAITTLLRDNPNANTPIEAEPEPAETEDAAEGEEAAQG